MRLFALLLAACALLVGAVALTRGATELWSLVRSGKPSPGRTTPVGSRLVSMVRKVVSHTHFAGRPFVTAAHWLVMVSFPILAITLASALGQIIDPTWAVPGLGTAAVVNWVVEFFAWGGLVGIGWLMAVRFTAGRARSSRFFGSNHWQGIFVEVVIAVVVIGVLVIHVLQAELYSRDASTAHLASTWQYPLTLWLTPLVSAWSTTALGAAISLVAFIKVTVSAVWLIVVGLSPAMGVAWHRFLAFFNIYFGRNDDGSKALGRAAPLLVHDEQSGTSQPLTIDVLETLDENSRLGVGSVSDMTWPTLLDTATCTECGRCQDACPAWMTGKPLSPKGVVTDLRDHAVAAHTSEDIDLLRQPLMPDIISDDVLWACTQCGACVEQCPVDIEIVDVVLDLRRSRTLMDSAFPKELNRPMRQMESKSNPFGMSPRKRLDWTKTLDFPVPVIGEDIDTAEQIDYLYWVGCAGAFDDKGKQTAQAVAELLHTAGVPFGVLGQAEGCTGDPARRAGNEILYQTLAAQNISTLNEAKVTRIVASCAHCFNTLAKEYPELGGTYEVLHHTQVLNRLIRDGKLTLAPPTDDDESQTLTYHDPCFLGRHNQVYSPPRELLQALPGTEVNEMPRSGQNGLCCGAGGANAFREETAGERIADVRVDEAIDTGAQTIATACPFCTTMLGSAGKDVQIRDVATLMLDSVRRAKQPSA